MNTTQFIVVAGVVLGIVQLTAGVVIGLWIARRGREDDPGELSTEPSDDQQRATRLAADLRGLTATVAKSVRRHNAAIESIDQRLRAEVGVPTTAQLNAPLTNLVVGVVSEMLTANQRLQAELTQAEDQLARQSSELMEHQRQALTDPLTGLPNRRALDDHLRSRLGAWRKHGESFAVLMLDIDRFKQLNDTYGHATGDMALVGFATAVAGALRKGDVVARYGGEEFCVLLPHTTLEEAGPAVAKIRRAISELRVEAQGTELAISASGGLASIAAHESTDQLIGRADQALYAAKRNGRDRVWVHEGSGVRSLEDLTPLCIANQTDSLAEDLSEACQDLRAGLDRFMAQAEEASGTSRRAD